jgi:putative spermidine/putrescine transport system permease protein
LRRPSLTGAVALLTLFFLALPIIVVVPMSFSSASSLSFPPTALSLRWYRAFFGSDAWLGAMETSLALACMSSSLCVALGSLAAYGLRRRRVAFRGLVESDFMAPIVLPTIVTAVALYVALSRVGLLGSFAGLVLAHTILMAPYVIVVMGTAFRSFDLRLEQVSWTMGASWAATMRRVVVPLLAPNLAAAWIFAFVGSFDEVVVTSFIAGTHDTIPKRMFNELTLEISPTITAVATLLIGFTVASLGAAALILRRAPSSAGS